MPAHHRAIGPNDEGVFAIGTLRRPAGQPQVTSHLLRVAEQEGILIVDSAHNIHRAGPGGNYEAIAVFQLHIGQAIDSLGVL